MTLAIVIAVAMTLGSIPKSSAAETRPVTIEFWTIALQPLFTDFINDLIARFEKANPNIKVRWLDLACEGFGCESYEKKLIAAIAGNVAPDVVNLNTLIMLRLASKGALVPISDKIPNDTSKTFFANFWNSTKYKGKHWALPWYVAPPVLMYNAAIFRKAGLDPLKPPQTYDEVIKYAKIIKDRTGIYGFMPNINGALLYYRFQEMGLPVFDERKNLALFNTDAHAKVLALYASLFENDYFPADTLIRGYYGAVERYAAGELAMLITGPQFLTRIKRDGPQAYAETLVAPYPQYSGAPRLIDAPLMNIAIPSSSKNQGAALKFALFVTSEDQQVAFSKETVIFPSTVITNPLTKQFFLQGGKTPEALARKISFESLGYAKDLAPTIPADKNADLVKVFTEAIQSALYRTKTAKQALDFAVSEWNRILRTPTP
jgi:putative chitobiose transport system substrate-binding protein